MYSVAFGKGTVQFELPPSMRAHIIEAQHRDPLVDPPAAIRAAMENPIGSPRLCDLVKAGDRVALVVTDVTRLCPDDLLVPALLEELGRGGVRDADVTIVIGIGTHRPSSEGERVEMLGRGVVERVKVIDPTAYDQASVVDLGLTAGGVPALISRVVAEADVVVATGVVEPHLYAGFSGGSKTVAIGAGGEETIRYTHSPQMLDRPGTRLGVVEGNPFRQALEEIGRLAGLKFVLNVVMNDSGQMIEVKAGEPIQAHRALVEVARAIYTAPVPEPLDLAIAGIGYPKDSNLYQSSRIATNLWFAPTPVLREGGIVLILATCQEGVGQGRGEQQFYEIMRRASDPETVVREARDHGYEPGGQRAFVVSEVLRHYEVVVVGSECPGIISDVHMVPLATLDQALDYAMSKLGGHLTAGILPHALLTIPVVTTR
jgi:lactate racemase